MKIIDEVIDEAKKDPRKIILPEGEDGRIIRAAVFLAGEGIARIALLGSPERVVESARAEGLDPDSLSDLELIDPGEVEIDGYAEELYDLRRHRGMTRARARELARTPVYFACLAVRRGEADGFVAGAVHTTGDVVRPALRVIRTEADRSIVSSFLLMVLPEETHGEDGVLFFADCAINPVPDPEQLAEIALTTAESSRSLADFEPRVAMLSFSTRDSARHELVDRVQRAVELVRGEKPGLSVDGEIQVDAALCREVAERKGVESEVGGRANILIFPDLQSGNIGYKLVERLAGAKAVGPILQGLKRPVNDLSRGCNVQDVINVTAITALQARHSDAAEPNT